MVLTNRDVALLVWLAAVAIVVLARPQGRKAVGAFVGLLRGKVGVIVLAYAAWIASAVVVAYGLGIWVVGLLNETVAWLAVPGLVLLFGFQKAYEESGYYGRTLLRVVGLTALVEFYVNLATFDLWAELLLLPLIVILGLLSAVAGLKPDTQVVKRIVDRLISVLGLVLFFSTSAYVITNWESLDKTELALLLLLPIWLTAATLPFIFAFSLFANYESIFRRIDWFAKDDPRARRRAKLAVLVTYGFRNRELRRFAGPGAQELARATGWSQGRRIIAFFRAKARLEDAKAEFKAKRLARYAGVAGTDWEGGPLDQREFDETKNALRSLHTFHSARHGNGRYRVDMMTIVSGLLSKTFPESEIAMTVGPRARSWWAWRRTIGGWVFGIGAAGAPPDAWTWEGLDPPEHGPGPGTDWIRRGFDEEEAE